MGSYFTTFRGFSIPARIIIIGGALNAFGNGIVFPFLFVYIHNALHLPYEVAGAAMSIMAIAGLVVGPIFGKAADIVGYKLMFGISLLLQAFGYGLLALVTRDWQVFLVLILAGAGNGGFWPVQLAIMQGLAEDAQRSHLFVFDRVGANAGIGLGGLAGGAVMLSALPYRYTLIFEVDAASFLLFLLLFILSYGHVIPQASDDGAAEMEPEESEQQRSAIYRDRTLIGLAAIRFLLVLGGYALFETALTLFAFNRTSLGASSLGWPFFVNAFAGLLIQVPLAKALQGRNRMGALFIASVIWAAAWLLLDASAVFPEGRSFVLGIVVLVAFLFSIGEAIEGVTYEPLVADLSPPARAGQYMSVVTSSWQLGLVLAPTMTGFFMKLSPGALWPFASVLCLVAGTLSLLMNRIVPQEFRHVPVEASGPVVASTEGRRVD
ncbi:MFS transporter [Sulfobacillus harzensis]|uniref:MFS transporter n=1 Tax=Sulfobacillus harzensis TaxID=2729629 RepID=A0A7Y0L3M5_9FIRM|nr:MFS transporter [Sulfobacillus harzensis]